jgi:EAL domain-containing protein (putative c-di-GMP-specific phosphodiesterase class I)
MSRSQPHRVAAATAPATRPRQPHGVTAAGNEDTHAKGLLDADGRLGLDRVLALAHCHLRLDAVFLAELTGTGQVFRAVAGDVTAFEAILADGGRGDRSYCGQLVAGAIPSLIPDTAADAGVSDLAVTHRAPIGSFIGVPVRLSDGTSYGALCGLGHAADYTLDERDVRFMSMLGELIVPELDEQRAQERLRADIMRLVDTDRVDIAYQPIIDLREERCIGIEALARFPDPFGPPDETLIAAKTVGLSLELERLAIRNAWQIIPYLGPRQFLALNVSPEALVELARRANLRTDLPLDQLVVEITEHAAVESYAALHRELTPLRRRGLRIAVDDAGAGFASLRHVLELQPDFIKVDRSLIHGIADDHARRVATGAFLSLAVDLGATVVAEGIERPADLRAVRDLGLHTAQGYLLGEPTMNPEVLARWIGARQQGRAYVPAGRTNGHSRPDRDVVLLS